MRFFIQLCCCDLIAVVVLLVTDERNPTVSSSLLFICLVPRPRWLTRRMPPGVACTRQLRLSRGRFLLLTCWTFGSFFLLLCFVLLPFHWLVLESLFLKRLSKSYFSWLRCLRGVRFCLLFVLYSVNDVLWMLTVFLLLVGLVFFFNSPVPKKKKVVFLSLLCFSFLSVLSCPFLLQAVALFVSWLIMITCGPNMVAWKSDLTSKLTFFLCVRTHFPASWHRRGERMDGSTNVLWQLTWTILFQYKNTFQQRNEAFSFPRRLFWRKKPARFLSSSCAEDRIIILVLCFLVDCDWTFKKKMACLGFGLLA